jgi:hypothetical protein
MRQRHIIALVIAVAAVVAIVFLLSPVAVDQNPGASNTVGPAEGGALETGAALKPEEGYRKMAPRDMPPTIASYPPPASETASPGQ